MQNKLRNGLPTWFGMIFILMGVYSLPTDAHNYLLSVNDKAWYDAMNAIHWNQGVKYWDYGVIVIHGLFIVIGILIILNKTGNLKED